MNKIINSDVLANLALSKDEELEIDRLSLYTEQILTESECSIAVGLGTLMCKIFACNSIEELLYTWDLWPSCDFHELKFATDKFLSSFSEIEQHIIKARFGLEDGHSSTQKDVAENLGISVNSVRYKEKQVITYLKEPYCARILKEIIFGKSLINIIQALFNEKEILEKKNQELEEKNIRLTSHNPNLEDINFSVRTYNCLQRAGINNLNDLKNYTIDKLLKVRNLGRKGCEEVLEKLAEYGITLDEE